MRKSTNYIGALIMENDSILQFIQTAEGRIVAKENEWDYQYHLKDHLGNVRTTFTANPDTEVFATSFETTEHPLFDNYKDQFRDMAYKRTGSYSSRLSSDDNMLIGLAKSLKVYPGDTINAEAYVRQLEGTSGNVNDLFALLASGFSGAFANSAAGLEGSISTVSEFIYPPTGTGGIHDEENENHPKLYLNLLYFDNDMNLITSAYDQSSNASTTGFERLFLEDVLVPMEGYMFIYVSNQEEQANIAYFDDITIEHKYSPVLQSDDYYPFGLQFSNGYQRTSSKENRYLYNSFEKQVEWGVYDYQARYYDPALGRFLNVDPAADLMRRHSPYNYAFDNPIRFIDPDGMVPSDVVEDKTENDPCKAGNCLEEVEVIGKKPMWKKAVEGVVGGVRSALGFLDDKVEEFRGEPDPDGTDVIIMGDGDDAGAYKERTAKNTLVLDFKEFSFMMGAALKSFWKEFKLVKPNSTTRTVSNPSDPDRTRRVGESMESYAQAQDYLPESSPDTLWTVSPNGTRGKVNLDTQEVEGYGVVNGVSGWYPRGKRQKK